MLALDSLTLGTRTLCPKGSIRGGHDSPATREPCCLVETFIWSEAPAVGCALAAPSVAASAVGILGAAWREQDGHPRQCGAGGRAPSWVPRA